MDRHAKALPEAVASAVRKALAEEHEVQLRELVLIRQGSLPKTSSGKVQRQTCRALHLKGGLEVVGRSALEEPPVATWPGARDPGAPREIEGFLRAELARVTRIPSDRIDPRLPLVAVGLDSLAVVELHNSIQEEFGAAPPVQDLLDSMSMVELARRIAALSARARPATPSAASGIGSEHPLSFGQQMLWILQGLDPASVAYNLAGAARLGAGTEPEILGRALQALVDNHPALRTTYSNGPEGPLQRTSARAVVAYERTDASSWGPAELRRRLDEVAFRPFDLEKGPVFRAAFFDRGPEDPAASILVLAVHHIAADFWSFSLLVRELAEVYAQRGRAHRPALPFQPGDLARRLREQGAAGRWEEGLEQARRQLGGSPPLDLPLDRPRPAFQTWRGTQRGRRLEPGLLEGLSALARRHGATLFMTLLAGFESLLSRYGRQEDFLVGTPTSGRSSRELESVVGYLVNPVPVRADLSGDPEVATLLARVRRATLDALERSDLPFLLLAERLKEERDPSRPAVFQTMMVLQRALTPELEALSAFALGEEGFRLQLDGLRLESVALTPPSAQFDLLLLAAHLNGDLAAALQFNLDLFDVSTGQRMLEHFATLLAAMARGDGVRLSDLPLLSPAEEQQLLVEWNATAAGEAFVSLREVIETQVGKTPEALAVVCDESSLSYQELNVLADSLARHLAACGVGPEVRVGFCLERSTELLVALLANLKAGGAYVPIDPSYPPERLAYMLADSRVAVVLTQERVASRLPGGTTRVLLVDRETATGDALEPRSLAPSLGPDSLAYILYTSGSTGWPKGAMNSHRAIVNRLLWMQKSFPLTAADRVFHKTPASFDVSVWELFWPLMTGACLVVARPEGHLDPCYLRDEIMTRGVTTVHFVPSLLQIFLDQPGLERCASLRRVIVSGEALSRELAARFHVTLGGLGVELYNLYGPAEAAVDVTCWPCPDGEEMGAVPIGRPIDNTRIHLLDRSSKPVPLGCAGELHIGGVQVGRGYFGRPALTAERFVPDSFTAQPGGRLYRTGDLARHRPGGEVEFLGRIDHQVKVKGVRIELGEVEHALLAQEGIREAVVISTGEAGALRLVAYMVATGKAPSAAALRASLQERLPEVSIPSAWVFLSALPLSPSGKVDRKALPAPGRAPAGPLAAPSNANEKELVRIWSEVLRREPVGVDDNFFALGGDSILGLQVLSRAARVGLRLTARQIFRHPTVRELARVAERIGASGEARGEEELHAPGEVPLTPAQGWFFEQEFGRPHHWNWDLATLLTVQQPCDPGRLSVALDRLALHHDALRLRFFRAPEGWRQQLAESGEGVPCLCVDLSALAEAFHPAAMDAAAASAQASLALGRGPLMRAVLFDLGAARPARLLLIAHHLVVDGVSWRILLEDLATAYGQLCARRAVTLPPKTTSFQAWARRLAAHARAAGLGKEASYWLAQKETRSETPSRSATGTEASTRKARGTLTLGETQALLHRVHGVYQTRTDDFLRTALLRAFRRMTGRRSLLLDLEGHGREDLFPGFDVSRTVGWFTAIHTVRFDLGGAAGLGEELRAVKEQGRRIPQGGVGYGVLRHLAGDPELAAELRQARAEVLLNYLGQVDGIGEGCAPFVPSPSSPGRAIDPWNRRSHRWIVNCWISSGRLESEWGYDAGLDRPAEIERLAHAFMEELRALVAHCLEPGAGSYTASDFPEADLTDRDLQKLMHKLGRSA